MEQSSQWGAQTSRGRERLRVLLAPSAIRSLAFLAPGVQTWVTCRSSSLTLDPIRFMKQCHVFFFVSKPPSLPKKFESYLRKVTRTSSWTYVGRVPSEGAAASRRLTPRQYEVLRELTLGKGVKEIARFLKISPKTVETHRSNLMHRLGMRRLPDLVRFALRSGVLPFTWIFEEESRPQSP